MSGNEIYERRVEIEHRLHTLVNSFILTKEVRELTEELDELQKKCNHDYVNSSCVYCGRQEDK